MVSAARISRTRNRGKMPILRFCPRAVDFERAWSGWADKAAWSGLRVVLINAPPRFFDVRSFLPRLCMSEHGHAAGVEIICHCQWQRGRFPGYLVCGCCVALFRAVSTKKIILKEQWWSVYTNTGSHGKYLREQPEQPMCSVLF